MTTLATTEQKPSDLPEPVRRRGINEAQWRPLKTSLYPGAKSESVLMVIDYCAARHLDPLKKPCHIVPMEVKVGDKYEWRDVVLPGIYELRTTAQRTGLYLGHSEVELGEEIDVKGVKAPEWASMTMYRWNEVAKMRAEFPVEVFFTEVCATKRDGSLNARWSKAPAQMLKKCLEAAGLREAFPDEIGGEHTEEELDGQRAIDLEPSAPPPPRPDGFNEWLPTLTAAADQGADAFTTAWKAAPATFRMYLTGVEPDEYERLRKRAATQPVPIEPADDDPAA
jgi:phage recombination protein Bet